VSVFLEMCDGLSDSVSEAEFLDAFNRGVRLVPVRLSSDLRASVGPFSELGLKAPGPLHRRVILGRLLRFVRGLS